MFGWKGPISPEQAAQIATAHVHTWLATAVGVPGFIGFAVG
jgi:hypothetical protein